MLNFYVSFIIKLYFCNQFVVVFLQFQRQKAIDLLCEVYGCD